MAALLKFHSKHSQLEKESQNDFKKSCFSSSCCNILRRSVIRLKLVTRRSPYSEQNESRDAMEARLCDDMNPAGNTIDELDGRW